jgi:hypothetical protein
MPSWPLTEEQRRLWEIHEQLLADPKTCQHHYHDVTHHRVGIGSCPCDYDGDPQKHRHGYRCCVCREEKEVDHREPEAVWTAECEARRKAWFDFLDCGPHFIGGG